MRFFQKLGEGLPVNALLHALQCAPDLWDQFPVRTMHCGSAHAAVSDILCFFNRLDDPAAILDDLQVEPYPAWSRLPQLRPLIFDAMRFVEGVQLGRVVITRLPPGGRITPHMDMGEAAAFYDRYQLALQSPPGCLFHAGDETAHFRSGELWHFDNSQVHSVENNSTDDRIVVIMDIRRA